MQQLCCWPVGYYIVLHCVSAVLSVCSSAVEPIAHVSVNQPFSCQEAAQLAGTIIVKSKRFRRILDFRFKPLAVVIIIIMLPIKP
jgi:hypothetical protein